MDVANGHHRLDNHKPWASNDMPWNRHRVDRSKINDDNKLDNDNLTMTSSGNRAVFLPPVRSQAPPVPPSSIHTAERKGSRPRHVSRSLHSHPSEYDEKPKVFNPEPLPFQSQVFKSSTIVRHLNQRHRAEFWLGHDYSVRRQKDVVFHGERYKWDELLQTKPILTQVEPVASNKVRFLQHVQLQHSALPLAPQRFGEEKTFWLDGERISFNERNDFTEELKRLRHVMLPDYAKDIYIGRGLNLPVSHAIHKPRDKIAPTVSTIDITASSKSANVVSAERSTGEFIVGRSPFSKAKTLGDPFIADDDKLTKLFASLPEANAKPKQQKTKFRASLQPPTVVVKLPPQDNVQRQSATQVEQSSDATKTVKDDDVGRETSKATADPSNTFLTEDVASARQLAENEESALRAESEMDIHMTAAPSQQTTSRSEHEPELSKSALLSAASHKHPSPAVARTPNPFRGIRHQLDEGHMAELREHFQRLDTDMDGHVKYSQLENQFFNSLTTHQQRFLKEVYDITSASTYFGLEEFVSLSVLCTKLTSLQEPAAGAFHTLNFATLHEDIIRLVEKYQAIDTRQTGRAPTDSLLSAILEMSVHEEPVPGAADLRRVVSEFSNEDEALDKLTFLTLMPYILHTISSSAQSSDLHRRQSHLLG